MLSIERKHIDSTDIIDFESAYDSIWRYKLIEKLLTLGIKNNMIRRIAEFISQRFCATKYGNTISKYKHTVSITQSRCSFEHHTIQYLPK